MAAHPATVGGLQNLRSVELVIILLHAVLARSIFCLLVTSLAKASARLEARAVDPDLYGEVVGAIRLAVFLVEHPYGILAWIARFNLLPNFYGSCACQV